MAANAPEVKGRAGAGWPQGDLTPVMMAPVDPMVVVAPMPPMMVVTIGMRAGDAANQHGEGHDRGQNGFHETVLPGAGCAQSTGSGQEAINLSAVSTAGG